MSELSRYVDERLANSITALNPPANPVDKYAPLTFTEWVQYNSSFYSNTQEFLVRYQSYLNNWFQTTNTSQENSEKIVQQYYVSLLHEIILNYSTVDEQRYISNLDYNNQRDLTLVVPFFAKKIKDVCLYFVNLRSTAKTAVVQYNLKGSNYGIETTLYNLFVNSLNANDITTDIATLNLSISSIKNNTTFEIEDIYDLYPSYYDINPTASASEYGSYNDTRAEYFSLNQYTVDPDLARNVNFSLLRAILSYPFYLKELGPDLLINPAVRITDLQYLKDSDYTNLIATSAVAALNLSLQLQEIQSYIGSDFYYVQTDSTGTQYISGLLFTATNEPANFLNKRFPTVAAVPSTEYLKTEKEIGLFFKPSKIGISNFTNFNFFPVIDRQNLIPNTVYYFPDPTKYGNVTSNTNLTFKTPFTFKEHNYFNKINFGNGYAFGDVATDLYFQTFRAYQSREQTLNISNFGISRYVDAQDFFTDPKRTTWNNQDVFPLIQHGLFPIQERAQRLLSVNKTLVQYKNDVYGNEYGLYKEITPQYTFAQQQGDTIKSAFCQIIDGYAFKDPVSGYNFDYSEVNVDKNYSGVTLKTVTNEVPVPIFRNGKEVSNVTASFRLTADAANLFSYPYQPEIFCTDTVVTDYNCISYDGQTFTLPDGTLLPDVGSDTSNYNPIDNTLYYNILVDAGTGSSSGPGTNPPYYNATFANPPNFTFTPPASVISDCDGYLFTVNGEEPCKTITVGNISLYVEPTNFADIHIPGRSTIVDNTLSGIPDRVSIYDSKNTINGDLYYRNSNSSSLLPASAALSAVFAKYPTDIRNELNNNIINIDVYYDVVQFETTNYTVFEQIIFDYGTNTVAGGGAGINFIYRGDYQLLEKNSTVWFDEANNELLVCKTTIFNQYSGSNYKIIYPKIFSFNLQNLRLKQIYPLIADEALTFNDISMFSLSGRNIELNIVEIDKPLLTYNNNDSIYKITYTGKDLAKCFYIFTIQFKYINGVLTVIDSTVYKPGSDVYDINFSNPRTSPYFETYTILGSAAGYINNEVYTFGTVCT